MEKSPDNLIFGLFSLGDESLRKMNNDYLVLVSKTNDMQGKAWV